MEQLAAKIQVVISTLEGLNIKSTYENMNRLLGSMQALEAIKDELAAMGKEKRDQDAE